MDFTEIYKQTSSLVSFSPGTHFLLTAVQDRLIIRRSDSFQIARTWLVHSTPSPTSAALSNATSTGPSSLRDRSGESGSNAWITHAGWSCDSEYVLGACAKTGVVSVFKLRDETWSARIEAGSGLVKAEWARERILQLHVNNFTKQTPEARLIVLTYLIDHHFSPPPSSVLIEGLASLPWDTSAIFDDNGINSETTSALASLRLLRQDLDVEYVKARIIRVAEFPALSKQGLELARRLFSTMDRTWFDYCNVRYDRDLAWIPTNEGLRRPRDCRDEMHSMLCDRVMPILDTGMVQSTFLRKMLGWDEPSHSSGRACQSPRAHPVQDVLTGEFGRCFKEATSAQLDDIAVVARQAPWVLTSTGELQLPAFAVFTLRGRLRGFSQISLELARRAGVKECLIHMGCNQSPTNDAIIDQLHQLQLIQASEPSPQHPNERSFWLRVIDSGLHETQGMYYNDLGSRAFQLESPSDRVQAHHAMPHDLCAALQISSLGSLHLQPLELDIENMREDLTTRIGNVLRSYDIDQAFNEFLANAADAGTKKFNIMLDYGDDRRADPSEVLCQNMAQFCRGPAVIAHNDAEFTMDDIAVVGRRTEKGRWTVWARGTFVLPFLGGSYILLLDPSGGYLPEESRANSYVVSLDKMRGRSFASPYGRSRKLRRVPSQNDQSPPMTYHANAARSLFFIGVQEITALETKPGRAAPTTKWSVIAQREGVHSDDENDNTSLLNIRTDRPFAFPSSWKSSWLVVNMVIPPEHLPDRLRSVVGRHRVKQLSIALATRTSPRTVSRDDHASHFHFFSSLPLPIPTSLPLHVHASFILADDRRNIRWDGDGTLTPDSECNHWLLSTALPPLYLRAIEMLNERFAEVPTPWPGNMDRFPDPISKALVDAFYSEQHLSVSPRRVFRTISGHLLDPSMAVVRAHMPSTVRDLLHQLCPDALVELPRSVRSRVIAIQSIPHTSPQYVHDAIASSRERFLAVCGNNIPGHTTCELVQGVIRHMLLDDPKVSIPPASLHGLPLLALADGTLADIEAEGQQADHIYRLFLDKGWNVSPWDESASTIALLRKEIPEGAQREVSEPERKWITTFWRFFDSAADKSKLLSVLNLFPLIPTIDERVFVSPARATNLPAILPPRASALSDARVPLDPLQKIGVLIVNLNINLESKSGHDRVSELLPQTVQGRLALVEFTFTRDGDIETKFQKLPDGELTRLTSWLRESLKNTQLPASLGKLKKRQGFVNVLRYLPIWPAFRSSGPSVFKSISASNVRLLSPQHARPANSITPFLLADPNLFFIEYSKDISRLPQGIQPMSLVNLSRQLKFPSSFSSLNMLLPYKTLLDVALKLGGELLNSLQLMALRSMFKSDVPEFAAPSTHKAGKMFVHPQLRSYEPRLVASGLRNKLTFENFKECVAAIHQDFDKEDPRDHDRCLVIYEWYTTRLPLSIASTGHWRQLDPYSFIPTRRSRRLGDAASFDETAFAQHLPLIVSPNNILRDEYSAVAWSQRALFHDTPSRRLFMADESLGIPTTEEVAKHLHVLATKIASQHPRDAGLVSDPQATYQYLQEHHGEAKKFLLRHRTEALFLNVDDPQTAKSWEFLPASQIMFNLSNEDDDIDVDREFRTFLRPFRDLLLASAEAYLSSFRAPIVEQRRSKILTDVVFRVTGAPGTEGDSDSDLWAHRALLATASEHFRRLFCGQSGFAESGAASAENPVVINLEDDLELRCVGLVLDHVYTGRSEESQDRECLLELMHLAHRWELAAVQAKAEALLVRTITTGAYREMREHAEQINASCLLEKIEEFERENAFVLKGL
ncbi:hypothetical protein LXA43DRAFT_1062972 [Ganoderma leucocontextum]|nr:hypothetical protein LXA43DRAFT_1062972 [Ganoderma leucocontextum]